MSPFLSSGVSKQKKNCTLSSNKIEKTIYQTRPLTQHTLTTDKTIIIIIIIIPFLCEESSNSGTEKPPVSTQFCIVEPFFNRTATWVSEVTQAWLTRSAFPLLWNQLTNNATCFLPTERFVGRITAESSPEIKSSCRVASWVYSHHRILPIVSSAHTHDKF